MALSSLNDLRADLSCSRTNGFDANDASDARAWTPGVGDYELNRSSLNESLLLRRNIT